MPRKRNFSSTSSSPRQIRKPVLTKDRLEFLLSPLMADAQTGEVWASALANWLLKHPGQIAELQPSGRFHGKTFTYALAHPQMTAKLRCMLARHPHLLPYML